MNRVRIKDASVINDSRATQDRTKCGEEKKNTFDPDTGRLVPSRVYRRVRVAGTYFGKKAPTKNNVLSSLSLKVLYLPSDPADDLR